MLFRSLKVRCRVDTGSLIHLHRNTYSVHSRLIGEWVEARLFADRVEVWYADKLVDTLPRLVGRDRSAVHYRHVIDSLVRKPGAFANYAYRDDLFPTTRFRLAFDRFCDGRDERLGTKDYLTILHHAARTSEVAVDDALRVLLASDAALSPEAVIALATAGDAIPAPTDVVVELPDLKEFDTLLTPPEETHGEDASTPDGPAVADGAADRAPAGPPPAGDPGPLPESGRAGGEGGPELPPVPRSVDDPGVRGPQPEPHPTPAPQRATVDGQDLGPVPMVPVAETGATTTARPPRRGVPEPPGERADFREAETWDIMHHLSI